MRTPSRLASAALIALAVPVLAVPAAAAWNVVGSGSGGAQATALAAPVAGAATGTSTSAISISITAGPSAPAATGYVVHRVSPTAVASVCTITGSTGSCSDTGLAADTEYTYDVVSSLGLWRSATALRLTARTAAAATDVTAPTTTLTTNPALLTGGYTNAASLQVTLNAVDGGAPASGVARIRYALTGATTQAQTTASAASTTFTLTAAGDTTVTYFAEDVAGNIEATKTQLIRIDRTAPTAQTASAANGSGGISNKVETGDSLVLTFSEAVKGLPSTLTVTLNREGNNGLVTLDIPGVLSAPVSLGHRGFLAGNGSKTATFAAAVNVSGSTVTVALGTAGGDATGVGGGSGTATLAPATGITDFAGNQAIGTFTLSRPFF